ncbi:hypothetical protein [Streptomyces sp. LN500]|uniref:hypothetical protein n=1 Tax=Streptomyces sp. LN500 TaxID=3112978 RepID=UPI00371C2516
MSDGPWRENVVSGGVARGPDGRLFLAAEDTTNILRAYARSWLEGAELGGEWESLSGEVVQLDPVTLRTLADALMQQADKMDVLLMAERSGLWSTPDGAS